MRLLYSPEAREDLREMTQYITEEFYDKAAASRARADILMNGPIAIRPLIHSFHRNHAGACHAR